MKKLFLLLVLIPRLGAQWIVTDPQNTAVDIAIQAGQAANHAEILRQWAANLENLTEQLTQLQAQLAEQRRMREIMGDPAAVGSAIAFDTLGASDIARSYGQTAAAIREVAHAIDTLKDTAQGVFSELDDHTVLNLPFTRQIAPYQRYAVIEKHAANLENVFTQSGSRLSDLHLDLADTVQRLKAASTQAETDKLQAKVAILNGQVASIEAQRRDAFVQLQAQQVLNENQAAKERQDLLEKQIADEQQAFTAVGAWQQAIKLTSTSYTQR